MILRKYSLQKLTSSKRETIFWRLLLLTYVVFLGEMHVFHQLT
jgi:hypothetical protein